MTDGSITTKHSEHKSAVITFSHPKSNSLTSTLLNELAEKIESLGKNTAIHSIVLKSVGTKAFCAGASFTELTQLKNIAEAEAFFSGFATVIQALRTCPCPIICRAHGKAVGGALGLIAASDLCFAHTNASIRLSELTIGFGPFVIAPAIERKIGASRLSDLALTTAWHEATWAHTAGLYTEIYASDDELDHRIEEQCKLFAASSYEAVCMLKSSLWESEANWKQLMFERAKCSAKLALNSKAQNLISSFLKK